MDEELYQQIFQYLRGNRINKNLSNREKQQLINKIKYYQIINEQLYKKPRKQNPLLLKVVRRSEFETLMEMMHDHSTARHLGIESTYNRIKERYYWNQMYDDIREYIKTCNTCQRFGKPERNEPLHSIKVVKPLERIGIDIVGPLPETVKGNKYMVVAIEYLTKWVEVRALDRATAENVANFIHEEIICRFGAPKVIMTDQGSHFKNQMVDKLCNNYKIEHRLSSPYHPQTNGLVERFNRTLTGMLAKTNDIFNWDLHIPSVLFAYRTTKHSTTKYTPFYLMYGREPVLPMEIDNKEPPEDDETNVEENLAELILQRTYELEELLPQHQQKAKELIKISQERSQKHHKDKKMKKEITYQKGDKVWLYDSRLDKQWSRKLDPKWKGPFTVEKRLDKGSYVLSNDFGQMPEPIHSDRLKLHRNRESWEPQILI
jgi:hypothetical protein